MARVNQAETMADLEGRVAVVTGGASGIGLGVADAFLVEGARVVLADIDGEALRAAEEVLSDLGGEVLGVLTDVSDLESVRDLAEATLERFGAVDVVCNNAGVWTLGYQWDTPEQDWHWVVDVNLWGVIHSIKVFVPSLIANPAGGHVVNIASVGGLIAGAATGPYSATKHAVVGLSKSLRAELALKKANVGVTIVCPGRVDTAIVERLNARPGADLQGRTLPDELEAIAEAMRTAEGGVSPRDAGRMVVEGVKQNAPWVFPGADRHRPLIEREVAELLTAFPSFESKQ